MYIVVLEPCGNVIAVEVCQRIALDSSCSSLRWGQRRKINTKKNSGPRFSLGRRAGVDAALVRAHTIENKIQ